jgi:hypothetical protein
MSMFLAFGRRRSGSGEAPGRELPEEVRRSLPPRFEAVGEALVASGDAASACAVVGRDVARDGAALGEALDGLRTTYDLVLGTGPDVAVVEAISLAWSEATLEFLHDLSCEDPLTGMASMAHLRSRLHELYRDAEQSGEPLARTHALVVVDLATVDPGRDTDHRFTTALRLVQVAEMMRAVFAGGETIARVRPDRAVAVVGRSTLLGASVAMLRGLLGDLDLRGTDVRVWIEGLPVHPDSGGRLLDELAR